MDTRMQKVFTDRGIKPRSARGREVIEGRGYRPYSAGEIDVLWAVDPKYRDELLPGQRGWIRSLIRQRDGIVMPRHRALPEFANPWAQIRPYREGDDDPGLITQRWAHRHVRAELHTHTDDGALSLALATRKENYVATRRHISGRWLRSRHPYRGEHSRAAAQLQELGRVAHALHQRGRTPRERRLRRPARGEGRRQVAQAHRVREVPLRAGRRSSEGSRR